MTSGRNTFFKELKDRAQLFLRELEDPRYAEEQTLIDGESGGRIALLIQKDKSGTITDRIFIFSKEFWIGRDPELNDYVLDIPTVALQHCRLCQYAGNFYIEDFATKNGTFLNGRRLPRRKMVPLPDRCVLKLSDQRFMFHAD